jgi:phi13 family phage major tail protein
MNKVKYGLKNVYYAVGTFDAATNTATYDTPVAWPGAVSLSLDAEGNTTKFRADNIDYWVGQSNNGYTGDFESALIPDSFRKDILGDIVPEDNEGIMIEDAGAKTKYFALLFQFEGDESATRHVMYKCSATRPSVAGQTTEEEIEPQTETLEITAVSIHNAALDKDIVKARCAATDDAYATWFGSVYQPVEQP